MPYRIFNLEEAARYLHLGVEDLERRVKDRAVPFEHRGGRVVFRKRDLDSWASQRILGLPEQRLAEYHAQSSRQSSEILSNPELFPAMLERGAIDSAMTAKTRASVLRELVVLADKTWQVSDSRALLESLEEREKIGSTALPGGFALPHPRFHEPYQFESSFVVVGRPIQEIFFGAPDGKPTDLFFLLCCQDDRLHLLTLARVCLMVQQTELLAELRAAPDAETMRERILAAEQSVLSRVKA
ncbi:MAG: PTS sugar transporter subunit IIA [Verrucomicrobiota bacterium]